MITDKAVRAAVESAYRQEWSQLVGTVVRQTGDWELAEECAQEAFAAALSSWPRDGIPERPGAWLTSTVRNRATDRIRRAAVGRDKLRRLATADHDHRQADDHGGGIDHGDERLSLIFTCCHPALPFDARVALTLRTLAGLSTAEIARAFLTGEATMAQRLVRAKRKIIDAGIPYRVPPPELLSERLGGVLAVLYLIFNQGYDDTDTDRRLTAEAIALTRTLTRLMPSEPEASGLLALMLLHQARHRTRIRDAVLIPLEEQDRSGWDRVMITEGIRALDRAMIMGRPGPYQLQAAIAACHATAARAGDTDWPQIAALYEELQRAAPSPVVELNRAVAVAMAEDLEVGLALVDDLDRSRRLDNYYLLSATRADLLRRSGQRNAARKAYSEALRLAPTEPERRYLADRLDRL